MITVFPIKPDSKHLMLEIASTFRIGVCDPSKIVPRWTGGHICYFANVTPVTISYRLLRNHQSYFVR